MTLLSNYYRDQRTDEKIAYFIDLAVNKNTEKPYLLGFKHPYLYLSKIIF